MSKVNTVKKGDTFEEKVYRIVKHLVESGDFGLSPRTSEVFKKKGYFSQKRGKDIIVDISIETRIGNGTNYSYLTIIECKNYAHRVPVDDIEEFSSKLVQIGEHNAKGFIFARHGFQEGVLNYAKNTGIGLARLDETNKIDWICRRKARAGSRVDFDETFFTSDHLMDDRRFGIYYNNLFFDTLPSLFRYIRIIDSCPLPQFIIPIPYISDEEIAAAVQPFYNRWFYQNSKLNEYALKRYFQTRHSLRFIDNQDLGEHEGRAVLGKTVFSPPCVFLSPELSGDVCRRRFTLAHEIGHFVLHEPLLKDYLESNFDCDDSFLLNGSYNRSINQRLEIQANIFASQLLLPEMPLRKDLADYYDREWVGNRGPLYYDLQPCNQKLVGNFLTQMREKYGVSKEAIKYRLEKLKLLEDHTL